jgi:hypothetical protein
MAHGYEMQSRFIADLTIGFYVCLALAFLAGAELLDLPMSPLDCRFLLPHTPLLREDLEIFGRASSRTGPSRNPRSA